MATEAFWRGRGSNSRGASMRHLRAVPKPAAHIQWLHPAHLCERELQADGVPPSPANHDVVELAGQRLRVAFRRDEQH